MTTAKAVNEFDTRKAGGQVFFENIHEPGCYLSNWSGHLIRIPSSTHRKTSTKIITRFKKPKF